MTAIRRNAPVGLSAAAATLVVGLAFLSVSVVTGTAVKEAVLLTSVLVVVAVWHRALFAWRTLIGVTILVIMFVPIRRYALPGSLPFQLELYRVLIGFVAGAWVCALLVDPRVRFVRSFLDRPLAAVFVVSAASIGVNFDRLEATHVTSEAIKQLTFLASFIALFYVLVGLVRERDDVDRLLRVLVACGTIVAASALLEVSTGVNVFTNLHDVLPFLTDQGQSLQAEVRGGRVRVVASSQHPIALGAMFVLLIPVAVYLATRFGRIRWLAAAALFLFATLATGSRTAILMLAAVIGVYLVLRPRQTARLWPVVLPLLIAIHFVMPGALSSVYKGFFPEGGLIADQAAAPVGSSRVTSLGPALHEVGLQPLLGSGFGARVFHGVNANSFIVDDQWLSTAMDTGLLGVGAWLWLFTRFLRRTFRAARERWDGDGTLFVALAACGAAFAVGMLTYDAFSFIQTTLVCFLLFALGTAALTATKHAESPKAP